MRILIIFICTFLNSGNFYCQLIRPNFIYENVIKEMYDHYNNTGIIMLHAPQYSIKRQGLQESENLLNLQGFFSRAYIPTAIVSIPTFLKQVRSQLIFSLSIAVGSMHQFINMSLKIGDSYTTMTRPLFVLLNDDAYVRRFVHRIALAIPSSEYWLIFLREETSIEWFFKDTYVEFYCPIMVIKPDGNLSSPGEIITEVYQINREDKLRTSLLGTWNQEMGIKLSPLSLYQRRNNLEGHTLRVTSIHIPPQSTIIRDANGAMIGIGGFCGELMDLLQKSMNFTILYREAFHFLGSDENGSMSGAIIDLKLNKTDIVATPVGMFRSSLNSMSYTIPVSSIKYRVYIKRPGPPTSNWSGYFISFEPNVWMAIVALIVITTITMFLLNSAISLFASHWKDNGDIPTSVADIFFSVLGVFCGQGMVASILDPTRITHVAIHLAAVVILTAYSADMISALTVPTYVLPFTTLKGLLQDGTYRFGVRNGSVLYSVFEESTNEIDRAIFNKLLLKEKNLPLGALNGFHLVCNEDKYAFMMEDDAVSILQSQLGCSVVPLDELRQTPAALGMRQRSPYLGIINSNLLKLRDSGIMQKLFNSHMTTTGANVDKSLEPVGMKNILPLLVLLVTGVFMSLIILSIEKFLKRNEKIIKKEKKIVKTFLKNIKLPSTRKNHVQPFYN